MKNSTLRMTLVTIVIGLLATGMLGAATVLTNGDGVIRNSLCVGFDCPNSPAFDDSTILLMENNTRIKFGDTSNSPFPNNDWEIEANSSLSGGQSYLGFNDCGTADNDGGCATDLVFAVEAGARQSALYVESDGDIGIGTSNPVLDLHIITGNTPAIRLDQDGTSGFTPQVWDLAGNETNFFVRDVTNGSKLPFRIRPNAPSSSIDIAGDGKVGVGTAAPNAKMHVNNTGGGPVLRLQDSGNDAQVLFQGATKTWTIETTGSGGFFQIRDTADSQVEFAIEADGDLRIGGDLKTNGTTTEGCGAPNCFPDYVFDSGYELMPLEQLGAFVKENKHLPNVPSAEDIKSQGYVNVSQLQLRMLEKIEELTLYTLQQQKTIDELTTRLAEAGK